MRDEDTSGLRFTFAYYIAALNYARATGDMKPALKVVHPQNQPAIAQLQGYEQLYMSATQWIVGGSWTVSSPRNNQMRKAISTLGPAQ